MHEHTAFRPEMTLQRELEARLGRARSSGLVDCKTHMELGGHSNMPDALLVLNNVLRLRDSKLKPAYSI